MTTLGVVEVGGFPAARYRLSAVGDSVDVVSSGATVFVAWVGDRLRVTVTHPPEHVCAHQWSERRRVGEWITIRGWAVPRRAPVPSDEAWTCLRVRVRVGPRGPDGFTGYRDRTPGPGYVLSCSLPPQPVAVG